MPCATKRQYAYYDSIREKTGPDYERWLEKYAEGQARILRKTRAEIRRVKRERATKD